MVLPLDVDVMDSFAPYRDDDVAVVTVSDEVIRIWMAAGDVSGRPLTLAVTVQMQNFRHGSSIQFVGPFWRLEPEPDAPGIDTDRVRAALDDIDGGDMTTPEMSPQDRSAVRILAGSNRNLAMLVLGVASRYVRAMLESARLTEANEMVDWMEGFATDAGLFGEQREVVDSAREARR